MTNLFSTFDPTSWASLKLNWMAAFLTLLLIPPTFWSTGTQMSTTLKMMVKTIMLEFRSTLSHLASPGFLLVPIALFCLIAANNSLGLLPHIFTSSSHLSFTVTLALPLWIGHMVLSSKLNPTPMLAHLVPLGTPIPLLPLMVMIEMVSSLIRPITLSVRLVANMTAGHLLLSLLSSPTHSASWAITSMILSALILLCVLETAVSMIQAYVFSVLSTLYLGEVDSPRLS